MSKKRGFSLYRAPWGYTVEWYDGEGTYLEMEARNWWLLPSAYLRLWWEVRRG